MTIDEFAYEWFDLSTERKTKGLKKLFDHLLANVEDHSELIQEILGCALAVEAEDYFGTEGFKM